MPKPPVSYRAQAEAVALIARAEAIRAVRKLTPSQVEMLVEHLNAAAATLRSLADEERKPDAGG